MDKITFEFFELVGAAIPGIPIFCFFCFLINGEPFSFELILATTKQMNVGEATLVLIVCYCIGFCLHYPAYEIFQPLMLKWGIKRTKGFPVSIGKREKELTVIRQKSPENFKVINKFMALRQMAYSLFFSLCVCLIGLLISFFFINQITKEQILTCLLLVVFPILFLRRSVAYHERIQDMITKTFSNP